MDNQVFYHLFLFAHTDKLFGHELPVDNFIQKGLDPISSPFWDHFFIFVTSLGNFYTQMVIGLLTLVFMLSRKLTREILMFNLCWFSSWLGMVLLKELFHRHRPMLKQLINASGYSFPSGHAMISLTFYGFIAYLIMYKWPGIRSQIIAAALGFLVILIGISRIYLNVHYASDVLAGYLFGVIFLLIFIKLYERKKV